MRKIVGLLVALMWLPLYAQDGIPKSKPKAEVRESDVARDISFVITKSDASVKTEEKTVRSYPQVDIPKKYRFANFSDRPGDGNCMWVSLDMVLANGGWDTRLAKYRIGGTSGDAAYSMLVRHGIPTVYKRPFTSRNPEILQKACDEGIGAAVTINTHRHAITLVGIDEAKVGIIDNNDPELKIRDVTKSRFLAIWDGGALIPLPKGYEGELCKQCPGGNCSPQSAPFQQSMPGGGNDFGSFGTPIVKNGPSFVPKQEDLVAFYKELGYSDDKIKKVLNGETGVLKQNIGDSTPDGKVVKIEMIGNKKVVTIEPEELIIIKRSPSMTGPQRRMGSPTFIVEAPYIVSRERSPLGLFESVRWSDGTVVEYGPFGGKRVIRP